MESEPWASVKRRAGVYATARGLHICGELGDGKDGIVFNATSQRGEPVALKVFVREEAFRRELAAYLRLRDRGVGGAVRLRGHNVPVLLGHDDGALAIEMTVVDRPFVLDFASAYLDSPPEFPPEVWEEREARWRDIFEADWPKAQQIVRALRTLGIHQLDPSPGNIGFQSSPD